MVISARILLIEDEENIADFLRAGLTEEGYSVDRAADGHVGWQLMCQERWDLVLLDWWLPGEDGLSLLKRFRLRDARTPVLFLTARDQVQSRVSGLDNGADDYLCKPFDFEELLARVRALLRRQEHQVVRALSYGDLTVDLIDQRAERDGKVITLSSKELALLVYFLNHPAEVLTREQIFEQVWKEPYDVCSNTLGVHIMALRRKVEVGRNRLIHTVRGRGYWFGASPPSDLDCQP